MLCNGVAGLSLISIHAPVKGATLQLHPPVRRHVISIHAPVKGATCLIPFALRRKVFQSTLP